MYRVEEPVKIERYILISRNCGVELKSTIYLSVPSKIRDMLKELGIDLRDKSLEKFCSLAKEYEVQNGTIHVRLIYDFWKPKPKEVILQDVKP